MTSQQREGAEEARRQKHQREDAAAASILFSYSQYSAWVDIVLRVVVDFQGETRKINKAIICCFRTGLNKTSVEKHVTV